MIYITEVRMGRGGDSAEHIEAVRWEQQGSPQTGESTVPEMVEWIGDKKGFAHVRDDEGHDIEVEVVRASRPYIKTRGDGVTSDNLLSLPRYGVLPEELKRP